MSEGLEEFGRLRTERSSNKTLKQKPNPENTPLLPEKERTVTDPEELREVVRALQSELERRDRWAKRLQKNYAAYLDQDHLPQSTSTKADWMSWILKGLDSVGEATLGDFGTEQRQEEKENEKESEEAEGGEGSEEESEEGEKSEEESEEGEGSEEESDEEDPATADGAKSQNQ